MGVQIGQANQDGSTPVMVNGQVVTVASQQDAMALQAALGGGGGGGGANAMGGFVNLAADGWDLLTAWENRKTARMLQRDTARLQNTAGGYYQNAYTAAQDTAAFPTGSALQVYAQGMLNLAATQGFIAQNQSDMEGLFADSQTDQAISAGGRVVGDMINANVLGTGNAMSGGGGPLLAAAGLAAVALSNNDRDSGCGYGYGAAPTTAGGYPVAGGLVRRYI